MKMNAEKLKLESERMMGILRSLDLSKREDAKKMYELSRQGEEVVSDIDLPSMINTGSEHLPYFIHYLTTVADVTQILEDIAKSPSDRVVRHTKNGHGLTKLSSDGGITRWLGMENPSELISTAQSNNSNLFLGVMSASAELASQSLNRYDTGLFFGVFPVNNEPLDKQGIPIKYTQLGKMVQEHEAFFNIWNKVILKYLSNVINVPRYNFSGESSQHDIIKLCSFVPMKLPIAASCGVSIKLF